MKISFSLARCRLLTWCANQSTLLERSQKEVDDVVVVAHENFHGILDSSYIPFLVSSQRGALRIYEKRSTAGAGERVQSYLWRMEISFGLASNIPQLSRLSVARAWSERSENIWHAKLEQERRQSEGDVDDDDENFHAFLYLAKAICLFLFFFILDYEINEYVILVILVYTMWKISLRVNINIPPKGHPQVLLDNIVCLDILLRRHRRRVLVISHLLVECVCCVCSTCKDIAWVSYQSKSNPLSIQSWRRRRWLFSICDNV